MVRRRSGSESRNAEPQRPSQGDVFAVAQLAGIQAAKQTAHLIPLCHSLSLRSVGGHAPVPRSRPSVHSSSSWVDGSLHLDRANGAVNIRAEARTNAGTGVEMEALTGARLQTARLLTEVARLMRPRTAAAVAALTVYDMVKSVTKHAKVTDLQLEAKSGGRSGEWRREGTANPPFVADAMVRERDGTASC